MTFRTTVRRGERQHAGAGADVEHGLASDDARKADDMARNRRGEQRRRSEQGPHFALALLQLGKRILAYGASSGVGVGMERNGMCRFAAGRAYHRRVRG